MEEPNLGARRTTKHVRKLQAEPRNYEEQITTPNLSQPAPDEHLSDLQKQGFSAIQEPEGIAYQPYNVDPRNKVSFDIQPTNPLADITATRHCEY
jgi:hypothetical protein